MHVLAANRFFLITWCSPQQWGKYYKGSWWFEYYHGPDWTYLRFMGFEISR